MKMQLQFVWPVYDKYFSSPILKGIFGEEYLIKFLDDYFGTIIKDSKTAQNYVRMFLELDAHSVYHLLETIQNPVLLISGLVDPLTPCVHSYEMDSLLPNSTHY